MPPKKLKHLLDDYLDGTDFKDINNTISIQMMWEKIVGNPISSNTTIKSFKNGIVTVELKGSCSGCPSSIMTLKQGVQNLLCHYIPEVKSVEAI